MAEVKVGLKRIPMSREELEKLPEGPPSENRSPAHSPSKAFKWSSQSGNKRGRKTSPLPTVCVSK